MEIKPIAFVDVEIEPKSGKILDLGGIRNDGTTFHKNSLGEFTEFLKGVQFLGGHNVFNHDVKYIAGAITNAGIAPSAIIDTLFLSPLLFPARPYHSLLKDDKLQTEDSNNPLNDSINASHLFFDEVAAFRSLDGSLQQIFHSLLNSTREFSAFFDLISYHPTISDPVKRIQEKFEGEICKYADLKQFYAANPVELAYCLALINVKDRYSITPPWVLKNFPGVERLMTLLRNKPCLSGCPYCDRAWNIQKALKKYFGFDSFRTYGDEPLQEKAIKAAVDGKSILAVFPTGGGKSITFQIPALISGENAKGLTIVISPLQSLMKDQVDNLEKFQITEAVTINGLLDPIERSKSIERVEDGSASLLYISPESLRSRTIERLLLGRKIVRFIIDEAHCFSSWGQDFRIDYLYIGDFIKSLQEKKTLADAIPVSCFTATAKLKVIQDIRDYFREKLGLELELFTSDATRTNLRFIVFKTENETEKYQAVRSLLEEKDCPSIIYVSRTKTAYRLSERLTADGFNARPYHGKMEVKEKTGNQNAFMAGHVSIMVATSAFGMGVDKKDIGMVIHYEISDSLENYVQEAGRAGRDENIVADCYVLYDEEDLNKHFTLLNQSKLSIKEIQQVWKAIKDATKFRSNVSNSALELARKAGWDENVAEIETRVTTAIAALEEAGYLKRGQNMPRVFANSILSKNVQEAIARITGSPKFEQQQKTNAIRIIKKLMASKSRKQSNDEAAEARIDYISDHLGISKEEVINIVNLLREERILADYKDLTAYIKRGENTNRSLNIVETFGRIENFLLPLLDEEEKIFHIKELNEKAEAHGCRDVSTNKLRTIVNFWAIRNWIKQRKLERSKNHISVVCLHRREILNEKLQKRHSLAKFIVGFLFERSNLTASGDNPVQEEVLIEFSVHELKVAYENSPHLFKLSISIDDIEDTLFYLSRIEAVKIEGGFLVLYNRLTIQRIEQDNKKRYTKDNYQKLNQFYESKVQQVHIVGEYAKRMSGDYEAALQFVEDYFRLNYTSFLKKYFPGRKEDELSLKMTPARFKRLFGDLSPTQLKIINDNDSKYIVVAAGPGSGKTKVLVHKLVSLLLMEDVKREQLLMITFSRAAATEFKQRLLGLIGNAANYIEIKTFHSYCFDLLGKVGNLEKSDEIVKTAVEKIINKEVEISRITKTVLVIDEAQDMDDREFALVRTLMEQNEEMRVIAVGDDDQNIFEFRGSSSRHLQQLIQTYNATKFELVDNYRSKNNLVDFTNRFAKKIPHRLKDTPIVARQTDNGKIRIVRHRSTHLILPLLHDLLSAELIGTTCVLTKTNEEALQITGLLSTRGMRAKLIQTNDGFNLYNIIEIRHFINSLRVAGDTPIISGEVWENEKRKLMNEFRNSATLEICNHLIKDFEAINPVRKYLSDLEAFIRESKLEDFFNADGETIFVSTIHKAKGKEFDNVFLVLDSFNPTPDEAKRQLYVAMTRAKRNLTIHTNSGILDDIVVDAQENFEDQQMYSPPDQLALHLTFKDINLDYFIKSQPLISQLFSGDELVPTETGCLNSHGQSVLKFSKLFLTQIETIKQKGYTLQSAKVNFIIYWQKMETEREIKIILPEVWFHKY